MLLCLILLSNLCFAQPIEKKENSHSAFIHPNKGIPINCDSIDSNDSFTICYRNQSIEVYTSKGKLKLPNLQAVKLDDHFPKAQIIQKNKLRVINIRGIDYKKGDGPNFVDLSHQFPDQYVSLKIVKNGASFLLETDNLWNITPRCYHLFFTKPVPYQLYNTQEIEHIEYLSYEQTQVLVNSESGYSISYPFLVYTKLKNGKFNLTTLEYLMSESPIEIIERENENLPKNLDSIKKIYSNMYLIEQNGLFTYYPLVKEIRFKKLEHFQDNFARFELPNGQKGWLDRDGREYLDE